MEKRKKNVPKQSTKQRVIKNPTVIAALVTAVATIIAAVVGSLITIRAIKETTSETYEIAVDPAKYPFGNTPVEIKKGDEIEIVVLGANSTVINCGVGDSNVVGMVNHEYQQNAILPTSNFCSLIGRIGPVTAPHFPIGAYTKFVADISGTLALGLNEVAPEKCSFGDCFPDNTGTVYVRIAITRE
jgi:hypothetical protein